MTLHKSLILNHWYCSYGIGEPWCWLISRPEILSIWVRFRTFCSSLEFIIHACLPVNDDLTIYQTKSTTTMRWDVCNARSQHSAGRVAFLNCLHGAATILAIREVKSAILYHSISPIISYILMWHWHWTWHLNFDNWSFNNWITGENLLDFKSRHFSSLFPDWTVS